MTFEITLLQIATVLGVALYLAIAYAVGSILRFKYDSQIKCALYGLFWPIVLIVELCEMVINDLKSW